MTERMTFSFWFCTINGLEERNTLGMITNIITESMIREKEEKKHLNNKREFNEGQKYREINLRFVTFC